MEKQIEPTKVHQYADKLNELTKFVNSILINIDQKTDDQPNAFFYVLAFKANNGLGTANFLIANVIEHPHFCDSLMLLLRTLLADSITFFYLAAKSHNNNTDDFLKEQIMILEGDHIKFMDKNLKVYQKLYNESDKDFGVKQKELRTRYPHYFREDGKYKYNPISITAMVLTIIESKCNPATKNVNSAFELYDTFSKYEHIGLLTTQLVIRQFDAENHKRILQEIYFAVHIVLLTLGSLLLRFFSEQEIAHFEKLETEILSFKIYQ